MSVDLSNLRINFQKFLGFAVIDKKINYVSVELFFFSFYEIMHMIALFTCVVIYSTRNPEEGNFGKGYLSCMRINYGRYACNKQCNMAWNPGL